MTGKNHRPAVAVVGLGIMGGSIARNLAKAGYEVWGVDLDGARLRQLENDGGKAADLATAASKSEVVFTCLPSSAALDDVVSGLIRTESRSHARIVADLSTLGVQDKIAARDRMAASGIILLDCPLSGTGAQAAVGDLSVYASGDRQAFAACADAFAAFARVVHYVGDFGNGMKMKFVANLLVAIHNVAAAEAILLGLRAGLDPATLVAVAGSGAGASRMLEMRGPLMVEGRFTPATMKLDIWQKDMALIAAFAESYGVTTPAFDATVPLYEAAVAHGLGAEDTAAVFKVLEKMVTEA